LNVTANLAAQTDECLQACHECLQPVISTMCHWQTSTPTLVLMASVVMYFLQRKMDPPL